jgi:hypothetical protein
VFSLIRLPGYALYDLRLIYWLIRTKTNVFCLALGVSASAILTVLVYGYLGLRWIDKPKLTTLLRPQHVSTVTESFRDKFMYVQATEYILQELHITSGTRPSFDFSSSKQTTRFTILPYRLSA